MPLRERKKERTRDELARVAMSAFEDIGYDETSMDDIAYLAKVSRSTAFRYFPSKEDLFFHSARLRVDAFARALQEIRGGETRLERVRRCLLELAAQYAANWETLLRQHEIIERSDKLRAMDAQVDGEWERVIRDALAFRYRLRGAIVAGAIVGTTRAVLREWFDGGCQEDLVWMGTEAMDILWRGIVVPPGDE